MVRGPLQLLLSGPASSGARATPADADPAGRNRIHLIVQDLDAPRSNGSRAAGVAFRTDVLADRPILLADTAGNLIKLFQPADSR